MKQLVDPPHSQVVAEDMVEVDSLVEADILVVGSLVEADSLAVVA